MEKKNYFLAKCEYSDECLTLFMNDDADAGWIEIMADKLIPSSEMIRNFAVLQTPVETTTIEKDWARILVTYFKFDISKAKFCSHEDPLVIAKACLATFREIVEKGNEAYYQKMLDDEAQERKDIEITQELNRLLI